MCFFFVNNRQMVILTLCLVSCTASCLVCTSASSFIVMLDIGKHFYSRVCVGSQSSRAAGLEMFHRSSKSLLSPKSREHTVTRARFILMRKRSSLCRATFSPHLLQYSVVPKNKQWRVIVLCDDPTVTLATWHGQHHQQVTFAESQVVQTIGQLYNLWLDAALKLCWFSFSCTTSNVCMWDTWLQD